MKGWCSASLSIGQRAVQQDCRGRQSTLQHIQEGAPDLPQPLHGLSETQQLRCGSVRECRDAIRTQKGLWIGKRRPHLIGTQVEATGRNQDRSQYQQNIQQVQVEPATFAEDTSIEPSGTRSTSLEQRTKKYAKQWSQILLCEDRYNLHFHIGQKDEAGRAFANRKYSQNWVLNC